MARCGFFDHRLAYRYPILMAAFVYPLIPANNRKDRCMVLLCLIPNVCPVTSQFVRVSDQGIIATTAVLPNLRLNAFLY